MIELLKEIVKLFNNLFSMNSEERAAALRVLRKPVVQILLGTAALGAETFYASRRWPYESSVYNHLVSIPLVTAGVSFWRPQQVRLIAAACAGIHAAGFSGYLPAPAAAMTRMAYVVGANLVLCGAAAWLRTRVAKREPARPIPQQKPKPAGRKHKARARGR
jgi:hypothetical protein